MNEFRSPRLSRLASAGRSLHFEGLVSGLGSCVDMISPTYMGWLWPCRTCRPRRDMTADGAITLIIDWGFNYHHSDAMTSWCGGQIHATISWPWQVKSLIWWLLHRSPACKCPFSWEHSDWKRLICCAQWKTFLQREDSFVISDPPSSTLPASTHPHGITSTRGWKYPVA